MTTSRVLLIIAFSAIVHEYNVKSACNWQFWHSFMPIQYLIILPCGILTARFWFSLKRITPKKIAHIDVGGFLWATSSRRGFLIFDNNQLSRPIQSLQSCYSFMTLFLMRGRRSWSSRFPVLSVTFYGCEDLSSTHTGIPRMLDRQRANYFPSLLYRTDKCPSDNWGAGSGV